jgi:putative phosphoesterase
MVKNSSNTTRVGLLADTHGFLDERITAEIAACDIAVHAGDVGCSAVLDALRDRVGEIVAIRGNNDVPCKWPADERDRLKKLPETRQVELPGGVLVVVHGDHYAARNRHAKLRQAFPDARAIVYGHSHRLNVDKHMRPWVLNPGAAGRARTYGGPSCLILSASARVWRVTERRFAPPKYRRLKNRG